MKKLVLSVLALSACAGAAHGQIDPSRFELNLTPVLRQYTDNGDGTFTATDVAGPLEIDLNDPTLTQLERTVRVELRYRINVTGSTTGSYTEGGSTFSSAGLASTSFNASLSRPLPASALAPAPVGNNLNVNPGFANPDPTIDPLGGLNGLYQPWRTGSLPANATEFGGNNGVLVGNQIMNILPLSASSPNQLSTQTLRSWSLYAFDIVIPADDIGGQITVDFTRNTGSGGAPAPWLFFPRTGTATANAIVGTGPWNGGSVSFTVIPIPAPASAALLALGGLAAARRRR